MNDAIQIGGESYTVLFPDLFRPLSPAEETRLRETIRESGVAVPIVVDEENGIIDGINRARIAAELGLAAIPAMVLYGLSDEKKIELAYLLNDSRRHLSATDRQAAEKARDERIRRVAELRSQGLSTRAIAEETGTSQTQIVADLADTFCSTEHPCSVEQKGQEESTITGKDGKARPASSLSPEELTARNAKIASLLSEGKKVREVADAAGVSVGTVQSVKKAIAEKEEPPPVVDELKLVVPEKLLPAFASREQFAEIVSILRKAERAISELATISGGEVLRRRCQLVERDGKQHFRLDAIHSAIYLIQACMPHVSACAHCGGNRPKKDCRSCHGTGWSTKDAWNQSPEDYRVNAIGGRKVVAS